MCRLCDDDDDVYTVSVQHQTQALQTPLSLLSVQEAHTLSSSP